MGDVWGKPAIPRLHLASNNGWQLAMAVWGQLASPREMLIAWQQAARTVGLGNRTFQAATGPAGTMVAIACGRARAVPAPCAPLRVVQASFTSVSSAMLSYGFMR